MTTRFSSKLSPDFAHFADEKAQGVSAGMALVGVNIRQLNTVIKNDIAGAILLNNSVFLPAGNYTIEARSPAYNSSRHVLHLQRLLTISGTELTITEAIGSIEYNSGGQIQTSSTLKCKLSLQDTVEFRLIHNFETVGSVPFDLGVNSNFGVGRFAELLVWRY